MSDDATWFTTTDRRTVHDGFSTVHVDRVRMPDGSETDREVVEHPDAVAVVPVMDDGTVVLLRQYRHPVGGYVLEIPAGILDVEGESVADAGRRELAEEIRMQAGRLDHLTTFWNSAGWNDERTHVYLGRDLRPAEPDGFTAEAEEADMEIVRLPLADALAAVRDGTITDAKTVVGLLLAAT
jgi:ADP-ribose pyrophosphatase